MGAIIGEPFSDEVRKQIEMRQTRLAGGVKGTGTEFQTGYKEAIKAYTNKSAWCRLASSVDLTRTGRSKSVYQKLKSFIDDDTLENYIKGDKLAKNFILQGGSSFATINAADGGASVKGPNYFGVNYPNNLFKGSYGWGGTGEKGFVPQPGITAANTTYYNNGALSKTTVNIRCYSRLQLNLIDILYLRPGYTVLFEFGHSVYLGSTSGKLLEADAQSTPALRYLFNPKRDGSTYGGFVMSKKIQEWRENQDCNYEGVYGKIIKYSWTFNPDGSYDITTTITGMGTVIEGLKMNVVGEEDAGDKSDTKDNSGGVITQAKKSKLNEILYQLSKAYNKTDDYSKTSRSKCVAVGGISTKMCYCRGNPKGDKIIISDSIIHMSVSRGMGKDNGATNFGYATYMSLGALCMYLEGKIGAYTKIGDRRYPIFSFDVRADRSNPYSGTGMNRDKNYFLTVPGQFSGNPLVALLPVQNISKAKIKGVNLKKKDGTKLNEGWFNVDGLKKLHTEYAKDKKFYEDKFLGRIMKIPVCFDHIINCMETCNKDSDGSIHLIDFLQKIMDGINEAFGGINEFRVLIDEDTGLVQIRDEVPTTLAEFRKKTHTTIQAYGVKPQERGTFVKNISLNAELSDDFAAMVAIGAQASGNQNNANATSFSTYNYGLKDRVLTNKLDYPTANSSKEVESKVEQLNKLWNGKIYKQNKGKGWANWGTYNQLYNLGAGSGALTRGYGFSKSAIESALAQNTEWTKLILGICVEEKNSLPPPFFIPFNLQLTLDGISNIKLFQKFNISENVLPPSYLRGGVDLIVKAVNHSISPSGWETTLETLSVPSFRLKSLDNEEIEKTKPVVNENKEEEDEEIKKEVTKVKQSKCKEGVKDNGMPPHQTNNEGLNKPYRNEEQAAYYRKIVGDLFEQVFKYRPPESGLCAAYTYNFAYGFSKKIKGIDPYPSDAETMWRTYDLKKKGLRIKKYPKFYALGNANNNKRFWQRMVDLGYEMTLAGENITKKKVREYCKKGPWGHGDICVYYEKSVEQTKKNSHALYGHVQFYVGTPKGNTAELIQDPVNGEAGKYGWTTSTKTNYNTYMCYGRRPGDCWDFWVFRAPKSKLDGVTL